MENQTVHNFQLVNSSFNKKSLKYSQLAKYV